MFGLARKKKWPHVTLDEVKKRTKILVIDDSEFYYLPLFQKDGYTIEKWNDVDDLSKLETGGFDIILLDIQGVGRKQSHEQGFGILKHIRQVAPAQIVVAYSNADYSFKYKEFFAMADALLHKSDDYVQFKRTVDKLLLDRFSLGFYLNRVETIGAPAIRDVPKLRELAQDALLTGSSGKLSQFLEKHQESKNVAELILQVVQVGLALAQIWR